MLYCYDPTADEPIMLINKHIGMDETEGMGVDGGLFQQELLALDSLGKKRIQVWINSPGGSVMDGYNIYTAITKSQTPVDTYGMGAVGSIAAVIFQAGRKRILADYGWLMYHDPFGGDNGKVIDTMKESIITMISTRCGMTADAVRQMMKRESFILPDEAKSLGLCTEVMPTEADNKKNLRGVTNVTLFHHECNRILNSIQTNQQKPTNMTEMKKVTMRLRLNDSAPEDDIVKAIDAIENRAQTAEKSLTDVQNKAKADGDSAAKSLKEKEDAVKDLEEKLAKAKEALDACKDELNAMKTDKENAEKAALAEKAKNMVEGYAKLGRIKNEATVVLKWTNLAIADFEGTENLIKELPLNKQAVVIPEANKLGENELPTSAAALAAQNRLKRQGR